MKAEVVVRSVADRTSRPAACAIGVKRDRICFYTSIAIGTIVEQVPVDKLHLGEDVSLAMMGIVQREKQGGSVPWPTEKKNCCIQN